MANWVKFIRRCRTLLWTALSIVIITAAVIVGLGKLLLPYSTEYKPRLEAWLSEEFGRPVEIGSFTGEWRAFGPRLAIEGLKLPAGDSGEDAAVIESAVIDIKPFNFLIPSRPLYDFRIVGADFHVMHLEDGSFQFSGLGVERREGQSGSALKQIASIGEVILENSSLRYDDQVHDFHLDLRGIDGRLQGKGSLLSAEIGFRLTHATSGQVSGELEAIAHLQLDRAERPEAVSWQLSVQELMLGQIREYLPDNDFFPSRGRLNAKLWGDWDPERQNNIRGAVDLRDVEVSSEPLNRAVDRINTRFRWQFTSKDDWRLDLSDFSYRDSDGEWSVESLALGRHLAEGFGLWASADAVPVETPVAIARDVVRAAGRNWPHYIPGSGVGVVRDLELVLNPSMRLGRADGHFRGGSISDWGRWPDIGNIDGVLSFGPGHGRLDLSGRDVVVEWPRQFKAPLTADLPSCVVNFSWGGGKGKYQVDIEECALENAFVSARGEMRFKGDPPGKPVVDVKVVADRLDAGEAGPYWPRALIKPRAVDWLESGIIGGQLDSGQLQIRGDMDDWPFDQGEGRFEALVELTGAEIDYFPEWPRAREVEGRLHFVNSAMELQGAVGNIGGISAGEVRARVDDFRHPELRLEYATGQELGALMDFIRATPLGQRVGTDLSAFEFSGEATTTGVLNVPLRQGEGGIDLEGQLVLAGNGFAAPEADFSLAAIGGTVRYDESGFVGDELEARYAGKPASLSIEAGGSQAGPETTFMAPGAGDAAMPAQGTFMARLSGEFALADIAPPALMETWPPLGDITGTADWQARLAAGGGRDATLIVSSELAGIRIPLPEPLAKSAEARWPLQFSVPLAGTSRTLKLDLAERFSMSMSLGEGWSTPRAAVIALGTGEADALKDGSLLLGGSAPVLDLDGWVGLVVDQARAGKGLGGLDLEAGAVTAGELVMLDRTFEQVALGFSVIQNTVTGSFDAETISGKVSFVGLGGSSQSLSAEFERLVLDAPRSSGMQMDVDPSQLPALHLYASSLRYSGVELGETRIEAYPTSEGFHFETVEASAEQMSVRASGDWALVQGGHRSKFDIHMTSESLGDFLRHLNFASPVEGGQTVVDFSVWWDGSPGQFRLARLNGEVNFNVNSGVIRDASAGTGRLLGLLSVQSLPRRLALDFRDVFDSGFAFDEANGTFIMLNGSARTDDVILTSTAANISFSGTTDLVERRYDQLITVRPGLGNTLPVIGAIAGGPGGAAAGLALQGLLGDELGEASQVQYTLTGDWDAPQIEPVLKSRTDG